MVAAAAIFASENSKKLALPSNGSYKAKSRLVQGFRPAFYQRNKKSFCFNPTVTVVQ
jgi:hypothetical protein